MFNGERKKHKAYDDIFTQLWTVQPLSQIYIPFPVEKRKLKTKQKKIATALCAEKIIQIWLCKHETLQNLTGK